MTSYSNAIILGIVEGITEFLPVSSTGHLIISGHLLGFIGPKADTFEIVIQLGAILAVVVLYWQLFMGFIRPTKRKLSGPRGLYLLFLTSLPAALLGLIAHSYIKTHLFSPLTVAAALIVGALAILLMEWRRPRVRVHDLDEITPTLALGIGCFQCLALWPGFSRSAATIMGAMILGTKRHVAAEYSFVAAVPIMVAATGFDLLKSWHLFSPNDVPILTVGFVVAFISAWAAVRTFIALLSRITLTPFACYRLALAPLVLWIFW